MNEFLFWFLRPIAEFLGVLLLIASVVIVYLIVYHLTRWWKIVKKNKV